jgi:Tfp pilus assembly protein PilN
VKSRGSYFDNESLVACLKQLKHVFVVINNQQVLSKEESFTKDTPELITQRAFPNIALTDFYYEVYSNENKSFISVCRKQYVDDLIKKYTKNNVSVIGFSLGNLVVQNVLPFIAEEEIRTSNSNIRIEETQLKRIEKKSEIVNRTYLINDLEVTNNELLPLGGILSYYFENNNQLGIREKVAELRTTFFQKQFFSVGLKIGSIFLFLVLLINFLIFNSYYASNAKLLAEVQVNEAYKERLLKLEKEITQKEKIVAGLSSVSQSKVSLYLDELAMLVPSTISLTRINYQPIKTRIKREELIPVSENILQVAGTIKNNEDLTRFVNSLERSKWINSVILEFGEKKNKTSFTILIHIKDE